MQNKKHKFDAHYIKSGDYRTHYASGFYGGITTFGKLQMSFYVERSPLPKTIEMSVDINEHGMGIGPTKEGNKKGKGGVVRECQGGLIMDMDVAKGLHEWLGEKIRIHEENESKSKEQSIDK